MQEGRIRTIVYDARFVSEMAKIEPNVRRADEFIEGAETILSRDPEAGCPVDGSQVWIVCGHTVDAAIYYTFDENNVYFLSIEKTKMPEL